MTRCAISSQERLVACGLAHSWPSSSMQPKPPDWSHSRCTCARASSTVPMAPLPGLVDEVDHLLDIAALDSHLRERGDLLEVPEPCRDAVLDLAVRLLAGLG